ncbi:MULTISPECIES: hypothetical protein [unclassified Nocardia]|uniref:hypothetical protein n=1 Tax=unclassified Nocardia TaxID=2637762 RepID=UPI001CE41A92|nr:MULTISPECIES: hypothetical protein [unclassified Nocardia]
MPVDPTDPDTFEDEPELDIETPEADAAEQHADLAPHEDDSLTSTDPDAADETDRAEQARVVEIDEDDYR